MKTLLLSLLLCTPLLLNTAQAGRRAHNPPEIVEDALVFATADRAKAIKLLRQALSEERSPADQSWIQVYLAEQLRISGAANEAKSLFTRAKSGGDERGAAPAARFGLALINADLNALNSLPSRGLLATQRASKHLTLARQSAQGTDKSQTKEHATLALSLSEDDPQFHEQIAASLRALLPPQAAKKPTEEATLGAAVPALQAARDAFDRGELTDAAALARPLLTGPDASGAQAVLDRVRSGHPLAPNTIGVLLPLSGGFQAAGKQVKAALSYGYQSADNPRELLFVDAGSTAESAAEAAQKLILAHGAIALVGPLLSVQTQGVLQISERYGVPLISLSQSLETPQETQWVLQAMVTRGLQVEALVQHMMEREHMSRFGIFGPDNEYGHSSASLFRQAVEQRGGSIAIEEYYTPESTDLIPFAQALGQKNYEERASEFREIKKTVKKLGGNPDRAVLPPKLDFEALFLPDNAARVPLACAALAYEEFPIGEFKTTKDGITIPLLGLNGWNNPSLVSRGGPYARSSYFTDSFGQLDDATEAFSIGFRDALGHTPNPLEAVTVDAGRLLAQAAATEAQTTYQFRDALFSVRSENTATGATQFDPITHRASRLIRILSIDKDHIYQRYPAPEAPQDSADTP